MDLTSYNIKHKKLSLKLEDHQKEVREALCEMRDLEIERLEDLGTPRSEAITMVEEQFGFDNVIGTLNQFLAFLNEVITK